MNDNHYPFRTMLSQRISIAWPPKPADEKTSTMVVSSKRGKFVDIRVQLEHYPITDTNIDFRKVFEWVMVGDEIPVAPDIPHTYKIKFTHDIDSIAIWKSIDTGLPLEQCQTSPDVGTFWKTDGLDRKETGHLINPETGLNQEYIEIWRSLSPNNHTPSHEAREQDQEDDPDVYVLQINLSSHHGQLIRTGNWVQGLLYDKNNHQMPLHVVRAFFNGDHWEYLIKYSKYEFPIGFKGSPSDTITVGEMVWNCIE